ncbi:MAG: hypothetical protein V1750_10060 [Acidobacteriota bacterium]
MTLLLVLFQLPFLVSTAVLIGLAVYGGDFNSPSGYLYLLPVLLGPVLLPRSSEQTQAWLRAHARAWLVAGVALGALAYRPLHLGFWDQHSWSQTLAITAFATVSLIVGWLAAGDAAAGVPGPSWHVSAALIPVAACFFVARWYPHAPLLGAALIMAAALARCHNADAPAKPGRLGRPDILDALLFCSMAQLGDVVWDYGVDSAWGPQLGLAFSAATVAVLAEGCLRRHPGSPAGTAPWLLARPAEAAGVALAVAVSVATALRPQFLLSPLRQLLVGVALGLAIAAILESLSRRTAAASRLMRVWLASSLGLAFSSQLSMQLEAFPAARLVYLLPLALSLLLALKPAPADPANVGGRSA